MARWIPALLAALLAATAAQAAEGPPPTVLAPIYPKRTLPLRELARAARHGPAAGQQVQVLPSRLPDGTPTNEFVPTPAELAALPVLAPNTAVTVGTAGSRRVRLSGFAGLNVSQTADVAPPDQGLAVATIGGTTFVVEAVNDALQFFNGSGTSLKGPVQLSTFFNTSLISTDPRVLFDASTQRWFISILAFNTTVPTSSPMCNSTTFPCQLIVAVSKSSDPTGSYNLYTIDSSNTNLPACGASGCLSDQPHTGYDANGFYMTADLFPNAGGFAIGEIIYVFPKAAMIAGTMPITPVSFLTTDFVIMPSVPGASEPFIADNGGTEYMLTARSSGSVRLYAITNTSLIGTLPSQVKMSFADAPSQAYPSAVPASQPNDSGCGSSGTAACSQLDGGRTSFTGEVVVSGGKVMGALPSGANDSNGLARDVIAWFAVQPNLTPSSFSATIYKQGMIVPPIGYSIDYPVFAFRNSGQGVMGLNITGTNSALPGGFASAAVIPFLGFDPVGNIVVTAQGVDIDDDGTCPDRRLGSGSCRWGDYGAAAVDPTTGHFWTANELMKFTRAAAGGGAQWGTFNAQAQ